jgi:hypothetical protein
MIVVITSLKLKTPFQFFALSLNALRITQQLKTTTYVAFKSTGFWTMHYTMSLWETKEAMKEFTKSGAHLEAMKKSSTIAKEIRTLTIEAPLLPSWKEAKELLLKEGKVLRFY